MDRYKIVVNEKLSQLSALVNREMQQGWVPQGGVCVVRNSSDSGTDFMAFYQAMVLPVPPGK